jgi:chromosome segregation ATPase
MIEEMKVLEEQVRRLMEMVNHLKEDRGRLQTRFQEKELEAQALRQEMTSFKGVEKEFQQLQQERGEVRGRIEKMLIDLKGFEGVKGS